MDLGGELPAEVDRVLQTEVELNDEFLMSSLFTVAEVELARFALAELPAAAADVVVGGLGLGYTARAVLENPNVRFLVVVDALSEVIEWHERGLIPAGTELTADPRCELVHGDSSRCCVLVPGSTRRLIRLCSIGSGMPSSSISIIRRAISSMPATPICMSPRVCGASVRDCIRVGCSRCGRTTRRTRSSPRHSRGAIASSDLTILRARLDGVVTALRLARATYRVILQNLFWAFAYNTAMIPLAAIGLLNPILAGAAMGASSITVVTNSLRLASFGRDLTR